MAPQSEVHEAMVAVMREVTSVTKTGQSDQGYAFRRGDDVVAAVAPAMRRHGLALVPMAVDVVRLDRVPVGKSDTMMWLAVVDVEYAWRAGTGSLLTHALGAGIDVGADKIIPKAMTVAYRTVIVQGLALPVVDMDEVTPAMSRAMMARYAECGMRDRTERLQHMRGIIGRDVDSSKEINSAEWGMVMQALDELAADPRPGHDEVPS